jgi:hypothetical protein
VIAVVVILSLILTVSVLFPGITGTQIVGILVGGSALAVTIAVGVSGASLVSLPTPTTLASVPRSVPNRDSRRMPPLERLPPARESTLERVSLIVLHAYLVVASGFMLICIVTLAVSGPE